MFQTRFILGFMCLTVHLCYSQSNLLLRKDGHGKYGYTDDNNRIIIEFKFDNAGHFKDGLAKAGIRGNYGLIDEDGEWVIPCKYKRIEKITNNLAIGYRPDRKYDLIKIGEKILSTLYQIEDLKQNAEQNFEIRNADKIGVITASGKEIVPLNCTAFSKAWYGYRRNYFYFYILNGKRGVSDKNGEVLKPIFDSIVRIATNYDGTREEPIFLSKKNGYWGCDSKWLKIPYNFTKQKAINPCIFQLQTKTRSLIVDCKSLNTVDVNPDYSIFTAENELLCFKDKRKYGIMKFSGKITIKAIYDTIFPYASIAEKSGKDGIVKINIGRIGKKMGIISVMGLEGTPAIFDSIAFRSEKTLQRAKENEALYFICKRSDGCGLYTLDNNYLFLSNVKDFGALDNSCFKYLYINNKLGIIKNNFTKATEPAYEGISNYRNKIKDTDPNNFHGIFITELNNKLGIIDSSFKEVSNAQFDSIIPLRAASRDSEMEIIAYRKGQGSVYDPSKSTFTDSDLDSIKLLNNYKNNFNLYFKEYLLTIKNGKFGLLTRNPLSIKGQTEYDDYFETKDSVILLKDGKNQLILCKQTFKDSSKFRPDSALEKRKIIRPGRISVIPEVIKPWFVPLFGNWYYDVAMDRVIFFKSNGQSKYYAVSLPIDDHQMVITMNKHNENDGSNGFNRFNEFNNLPYRYGLVDNRTEKSILPVRYKLIQRFRNFIIALNEEERFEIYSIEGKLLLKDVAYIDFSDSTILRYNVGGKIESNCESCSYEFTKPFLSNSDWYMNSYYNSNGDIQSRVWTSDFFIPTNSEYYFNNNPWNLPNKKRIDIIDGSWGFIDVKDTKIVPPVYSYLSMFYKEISVASGKKSGLFGIINKNQDTLCPFDHDYLEPIPETPDYFISGRNITRFGYLSKKGLIPFLFKRVFAFHSGFAPVHQQKGYSIINESGKMLTDSLFDDVEILSKGFFSVRKKNLVALMDSSGNLITDFKFKDIKAMGDNLIPAKFENKYGFWGRDQKWSIKPIFDEAEIFVNHTAVVKVSGFYGLINRKNKFLLKPNYQSICSTADSNVFIVKEKERFDLINISNGRVKNLDLDFLDTLNQHYLGYKDGKNVGLMSISGKKQMEILGRKIKMIKLPYLTVKNEKGFSLIDTSGKLLSEPFDAITGFAFPFYTTTKKGKAYIYKIPDELILSTSGEIEIMNQMTLFCIEEKNKYNVVDSTGYTLLENTIVKPININGELFAVGKKHQNDFIYGITNPLVEQYPIDYRFSSFGKSTEGANPCKITRLLGLVNKHGLELLPKSFYSMRNLENGVIECLSNHNTTYFLKEQGKFIPQSFP